MFPGAELRRLESERDNGKNLGAPASFEVAPEETLSIEAKTLVRD